MIARNIAPGIRRRFAFEHFPFHDPARFERMKQELRDAEFWKKEYRISGSDRDATAVSMAIEHAESLGLSGTVTFGVRDFPGGFKSNEFPFSGSGTVVTNPPYGHRL